MAAAFGIGIAISQRNISNQQKHIARENKEVAAAKLNFDLFGKRLPIYMAARSVVAHVASNNVIDMEKVGDFNDLISEASFLFGKDIANYMGEIVKQATQYNSLRHTMSLGS